MEIDVIIPLYKPGKELFTLLDKLDSQSVPVHEVILLNTGEKYFEQLIYGTRFLEKYQNIKVYHVSKREFDHGGTRRMGVKKSSADIFVMMTQDAMPYDNACVEHLVEKFSLPHVKAAYARQLPRDDCRTLERFTRGFNYPEESDIKDAGDLPKLGVKTFFCSNVCAMYDRRTYEELGGFVESTLFNEDMIYAGHLVQAGYAIAYAADAKVVHSHNYGCLAQLHRNFDLGVSQAQHPEIFDAYPSEGEGIRMVKKSASYVCKIHKPWLLVTLFFQRCGILPRKTIQKPSGRCDPLVYLKQNVVGISRKDKKKTK